MKIACVGVHQLSTNSITYSPFLMFFTRGMILLLISTVHLEKNNPSPLNLLSV